VKQSDISYITLALLVNNPPPSHDANVIELMDHAPPQRACTHGSWNFTLMTMDSQSFPVRYATAKEVLGSNMQAISLQSR